MGSVTCTDDETGQLAGIASARTGTYGYDPTGNRLEAAPGVTLTYDAGGNLTSKTEAATGRVTTFA